MTSADSDHLAREIHAGSTRLVIATTGGGSGAIPALLTVPGASRSILAAAVPYSSEALIEWLGCRPDVFCSPQTARAMAMTGYIKARTFDPEAPSGGLACTASLASDRPKRGPHRAHLAYQTANTTATLSVELAKGRRTRAEEEATVSALLLNLAAEACGVESRLEVPLAEDEPLVTERVVAPAPQQALLAGSVLAIPVGQTSSATPRAVLPGAFHPLHEGHRKMAALAEQVLGGRVAFELSITNVDKPPLDFHEIRARIDQFTPDDNVWLSRAPHFSLKAELFPGATFVVGSDTVARVGLARYYGGQEAAMLAAIEAIAERGCRFLVFGRLMDGKFQTLDDLSIPEPLARICQAVPAGVFRDDISSSELRAEDDDGG